GKRLRIGHAARPARDSSAPRLSPRGEKDRYAGPSSQSRMSQYAVARRLTPLRTAISVALLPFGPLRMTTRSDAGASLSPSKKISISIDECAGITIAPDGAPLTWNREPSTIATSASTRSLSPSLPIGTLTAPHEPPKTISVTGTQSEPFSGPGGAFRESTMMSTMAVDCLLSQSAALNVPRRALP